MPNTEDRRKEKSQRPMGSGGGLFTRSGSVADPLVAERLSAMAYPKIVHAIHHDGYRVLSKETPF
jgi:hypothetical protein